MDELTRQLNQTDSRFNSINSLSETIDSEGIKNENLRNSSESFINETNGMGKRRLSQLEPNNKRITKKLRSESPMFSEQKLLNIQWEQL